MSIEQINMRLHQLLPTTEYNIADHKEESFKWAMNYQTDVQFLLAQNQRLREERDSFQRVGIRAQEVNQRLVEALELANKHISGKAEKFSEREKIPVLYQINEALQAYKLLEKKD